MDLVDGVVALLVLLAALHGRRVGAAAQLVSLLGIFAGFALGITLVTLVSPHLTGATTKTFVAVVLLAAPSLLLAHLGRSVGERLWHSLRTVPLARPIDSAVGALVGAGGALVSCWLLASMLLNSSYPVVSAAVNDSVIIRGVESVMPPVPNAFAVVDRYLSATGFPQVLVNMVPEQVGPVDEPDAAAVAATARDLAPSVVKVLAFGCGSGEEGSAFAVAPDLVMTNAHVVAGATRVEVLDAGGVEAVASTVYFDPSLDLAILRIEGLDLHPLQLATDYVERGTAAVVLGYPEGGPFNAKPAGILARFDATGRDIYGGAITQRLVYEVRAHVEPGNSGGPLASSNGSVLGVVFSRSTVDADLGYALTSPDLAGAVTLATKHLPVSTESCVA